MRDKFTVNEPVLLSDGTEAIFLGLQDNPLYGFFAEAANRNTFFGWKMSKVKKSNQAKA